MAALRQQKIKTNRGMTAKENDMSNYYRITGYNPQDNYCFIIDCYGAFEKLWQFSSYLVNKGVQVLEVGNDTKFLDGNIKRADFDSEQLILRANAKGKPEYLTQAINGIAYKAVKVADKIYIPSNT